MSGTHGYQAYMKTCYHGSTIIIIPIFSLFKKKIIYLFLMIFIVYSFPIIFIINITIQGDTPGHVKWAGSNETVIETRGSHVFTKVIGTVTCEYLKLYDMRIQNNM